MERLSQKRKLEMGREALNELFAPAHFRPVIEGDNASASTGEFSYWAWGGETALVFQFCYFTDRDKYLPVKAEWYTYQIRGEEIDKFVRPLVYLNDHSGKRVALHINERRYLGTCRRRQIIAA